MAIDYEALGEIEDGNHGWRSAFPELSSRYVPGEGDNPLALIVGEAPGATEDTKQRPFIGEAGVVLRQLMMLADLRADWRGKLTGARVIPNCPEGLPPNCWLTNAVKFRPPKNRNPTDLEIKAARPWLFEEWKAVGSPRLIIPVGGIALRAITGKRISILRAAGKLHNYTSKEGVELFIWPMVHPSFGIRNPAVQPILEKDWEKLGEWRISHEH